MSRDDAKNLQYFLTSWRERAGMSLRELATAAGTDHATISGLERGRIKPSSLVLQKLASALALNEEERTQLLSWTQGLAKNTKKISGGTNGLESGLLLSALSLILRVPRSRIKWVWVYRPSPSDYDSEVHLKDGRVLAVKLDRDSYRLAEGHSADAVPRFDSASIRKLPPPTV